MNRHSIACTEAQEQPLAAEMPASLGWNNTKHALYYPDITFLIIAAFLTLLGDKTCQRCRLQGF